jgi:hypothetical protein
MSKQTWSQDTIGRGAAAVLLAAAMLLPTAAGAHPIGDSSTRGAAHQVVSFGIPDEGPRVEELDPTDDGFIIIECIASRARPLSTQGSPKVASGCKRWPCRSSRLVLRRARPKSISGREWSCLAGAAVTALSR